MTDEREDIIVNFYDEGSPVHLSPDEQRRVERAIKEEGITKGSITRDIRGYIRIIVRGFFKGSRYERRHNARRAEARNREHLASVGQDTPGGSKS